ncbi:MAG: hypothetical protein M3N39_13835, partial [Pseudomonadota bacterium]|nr:hypothetical protein [Pseudomonadota bacterium]
MVDPQLLNEQLSARRAMLDELHQILSRLDQLRLLQEGAHVAMAIDALERRLALPAAAEKPRRPETPAD